MDQTSRKLGLGSAQAKDPSRSMASSDPSKGGRLAATALGRPHDHVKRSSNGKLKEQSRPQPKSERNENVDRERIKGAGGERAVRDEFSSRTKGADIPKRVKDNREGDLHKPKSADGTRAVKKEHLSSDRKPLRPEYPKSGATRPDGARARLPEGFVKKANLPSDTRKRAIGDVQPRSVTKIEPVVATSNKNAQDVSRSVKMVTGTVMKAKQERMKKKVFSLPGQRFEAPEERDALRLFYGSLHRQIPTSDMANIWLMEHGLLEADEAQKVLTQKVRSKSTGFVSKTPTPSKFSNGKNSKFKSEDLLELKPVSKKLKL